MCVKSGGAPSDPPSTKSLSISERFWVYGENGRCLAQCLEAGRIPKEVWNVLETVNEAWERLRRDGYGSSYDQGGMAAAAIGFFLERDGHHPLVWEHRLRDLLNSPARRRLWDRSVGACVYELVPIRQPSAGDSERVDRVERGERGWRWSRTWYWPPCWCL
jgi:hypothetical protein